MRTLITLALLLTASTASAQNMWQMNSAIQNQYNNAYPSYGYGYGYRPTYRPVYAAPRYSAPRYYGNDMLYRHQLISEQQDQTRALRSIDNTLQNMELDMMFRR